MIGLEITKRAAPLAISALVGASVAWWAQGVRLDSCKNEFSEYKIAQDRARIEAHNEAEKRKRFAATEYSNAVKKLESDHEMYKRCVAAGKCGAVRLLNLPDSAGSIQPASGVNVSGSDSIPIADRVAEEISPVIQDCAKTTLMLNQLQADIDRQPF